eukprot:TRINITY_DN7585_c0_g1_i1.p2 TRINITY_DN7585_c0_g1~~TRINITY_DN7585_c0_g1_i1.p2  ORF type:complete len:356 (+),score=37.24 TRINITY_DN7585_c0_g1_i1:81-1148(+)
MAALAATGSGQAGAGMDTAEMLQLLSEFLSHSEGAGRAQATALLTPGEDNGLTPTRASLTATAGRTPHDDEALGRHAFGVPSPRTSPPASAAAPAAAAVGSGVQSADDPTGPEGSGAGDEAASHVDTDEEAPAAGESTTGVGTTFERPCAHNSWDNLRVKRGWAVLRCRVCAAQWRIKRHLVQPCVFFFRRRGNCPLGHRCPNRHVHYTRESRELRMKEQKAAPSPPAAPVYLAGMALPPGSRDGGQYHPAMQAAVAAPSPVLATLAPAVGAVQSALRPAVQPAAQPGPNTTVVQVLPVAQSAPPHCAHTAGAGGRAVSLTLVPVVPVVPQCVLSVPAFMTPVAIAPSVTTARAL